jgi:hypothetical protein
MLEQPPIYWDGGAYVSQWGLPGSRGQLPPLCSRLYNCLPVLFIKLKLKSEVKKVTPNQSILYDGWW